MTWERTDRAARTRKRSTTEATILYKVESRMMLANGILIGRG
jgi:hypothetical protein